MTKKKATKESISIPPPSPPPDRDPVRFGKDYRTIFIAAGILLAIAIGLVIIGVVEGRL